MQGEFYRHVETKVRLGIGFDGTNDRSTMLCVLFRKVSHSGNRTGLGQ